MHLIFLISLDRVEFDGIKLKVSLEKIDRPRNITPGDEADDLSSTVLRNISCLETRDSHIHPFM